MKYIYRYILLICIPFVLLSCVKDEEDIFDELASKRMEKALKEYNDILVSAENGWLMKYYIGEEWDKSGGFNLIVKFDKSGEATITSEHHVGAEETSLFSLVADQGPVLTFNTYNPILHAFSEPQGSPATDEGDYEFIIDKASADKVEMRGKKYNNTIILTRFDANKTWASFLTDVNNVIASSGSYASFSLWIDNKEIGRGGFDPEWERRFSFRSLDNSATLFEENVIYTTTGIEFYKPIEYGGKTFRNFVWDEPTMTYTCTDNVDVKLVFFKPPTYLFYEELLGTYTLTYLNYRGVTTNREIKIEEGVNGLSYIVKNFISGGFNVSMTYSKSTGGLEFKSQALGTLSTGEPLYLYPWFGGTSLSASINSGLFKGTFVADSNPQQIVFGSNNTIGNIGFLGIYVDGGYYLYSADACYTEMVLTKK